MNIKMSVVTYLKETEMMKSLDLSEILCTL